MRKEDIKLKYKEIVKKIDGELKKKKKPKKAEKKKVNTGRKKKETKRRETYFSINQPFIIADIIGIILITIGISFLFNPDLLNIKIGLTLIVIAIFMIFMITGESKTKGIKGTQITIGIIAWTLLIFFIPGYVDMEMFFILIFIGLLVIKEFTDEFISLRLKNRINILISLFLIVFIVIMGQKIINI